MVEILKSWRTVPVVGSAVGALVDSQEAALAYDAAARIHHGPFARLNFPLDGEQGALES